MQSQDIKKTALPDTPGVYFFKKGKEILYIGKATSLCDRVKSYFGRDIGDTRGPLIVAMIDQANQIDFQATDSVLEALILEAALIKKHQPKYNTKEKDNKSFNYVVITDDEWPKVLVVRGRELENISFSKVLGSPRGSSARLFQKPSFLAGPFTSGSELREALKIIRKIFPFLDNKSGIKGTDNFYRQLGLAPGGDNREAYLKNIKNIKLFFAGKKVAVLKALEKEMKTLAKEHRFEEAALAKKKIFSLKHINDVALIKSDSLITDHRPLTTSFRIEAYDVAHTSGQETVGVMVVVEDGEVRKSEYRKFKVRRVGVDDTASLAEILERRANHPEWPMPNLIVVDGGKAQLNQAIKTLRTTGFDVPVVAVVKDDKHRARGVVGGGQGSVTSDLIQKCENEILLANHEAHRYALNYHRSLRDRVV